MPVHPSVLCLSPGSWPLRHSPPLAALDRLSRLMKEVYETTVRVRYAETDQFGVVYYANFFVWFEVGRVELLRQLGFTYKRSEEHTSELQSQSNLVCRLLLEKKKKKD